jgi:hypothetical protein
MTGPVPIDSVSNPIGEPGTPGLCTLGDLTFRIAPSQIAWEYHLDTNVTNTIGGRVVQVYGATLGDMTLQGLFGQKRQPAGSSTIELGANPMFQAKAFAAEIQKMVDKQGQRPTKAQLTREDKSPMHKPFRFSYTGDGVHQWDFEVYIKALNDVNDPQFTISHSPGKFAYGYNLSLFIVEDLTGSLAQIATDAFIERLTKGIGWQRTVYNGPMDRAELEKYLQANSPDGTIHGLILRQYEDAAKGQIPEPGTIAKSPIPGGAATAGAAESPPGGGPPAGTPAPPNTGGNVVAPPTAPPGRISTGGGRTVG